MNERHYESAQVIGNVAHFNFPRDGTSPLGITIPVEELKNLMCDCANIIRKQHQLSEMEPARIERAVLEGLDTETRVVMGLKGIRVAPPLDPTKPTILHLKFGTETGPMTLRISQIAAHELAAELNRNALTRGSV